MKKHDTIVLSIVIGKGHEDKPQAVALLNERSIDIGLPFDNLTIWLGGPNSFTTSTAVVFPVHLQRCVFLNGRKSLPRR